MAGLKNFLGCPVPISVKYFQELLILIWTRLSIGVPACGPAGIRIRQFPIRQIRRSPMDLVFLVQSFLIIVSTCYHIKPL
jgi:hypothetical protein